MCSSDLFDSWHYTQPEAAMHWLGQLPDADPRSKTMLQHAIRSIAMDTHTFETPEASAFAALTPTQRTAARGYIITLPIPEPRRTTLDTLLQLK